jgi:hypothetical protein
MQGLVWSGAQLEFPVREFLCTVVYSNILEGK